MLGFGCSTGDALEGVEVDVDLYVWSFTGVGSEVFVVVEEEPGDESDGVTALFGEVPFINRLVLNRLAIVGIGFDSFVIGWLVNLIECAVCESPGEVDSCANGFADFGIELAL